jgi:hypothetical protein
LIKAARSCLFLCSSFIKPHPENAAGFQLSMYQNGFISQVKSQKQAGNSGLNEKYRLKHLRFPTDSGMLKTNILSNVTRPRLSELDGLETTSDNLGEAWDEDETS